MIYLSPKSRKLNVMLYQYVPQGTSPTRTGFRIAQGAQMLLYHRIPSVSLLFVRELTVHP